MEALDILLRLASNEKYQLDVDYSTLGRRPGVGYLR